MELASRIFDVITDQKNMIEPVKELIRTGDESFNKTYWRKTLRMAALCHDIGHLPFSHAAEKDLLPADWDHERLTAELISSDHMREIWMSMTPPLNANDITKLALGPRKIKEPLSELEAILSEIIVGDAFGADRIDYLLRDSYHAGVAYGYFDHYRLIDTLRILPKPAEGERKERSLEPFLGVEEGGLHSAESLMMARYLMFTQVYLHHVRRIYDIHLKDFLLEWLPEGIFSIVLSDHLSLTDNEVNAALLQIAQSSSKKGHEHADRIINRKHFKLLYEPSPFHLKLNYHPGKMIYEKACKQFGEKFIRYDYFFKAGETLDFPVLRRDESIYSSLSLSKVLQQIPDIPIDNVFVSRDKESEAKEWLNSGISDIINSS